MKFNNNILIFLCLIISIAQAKFEDTTKINPVGFENNSTKQFGNINSRIRWKLENNLGLRNNIPRKSMDSTSRVSIQGTNVITIGPEGTCDGTYLAMKALIEAAPDGSEIHIASGTYSNDFANFNIVNKSITIIGGYSQDCQTHNSLAKTTISLTNATDEVIDVFPDSTEITVELENLIIEGGAHNNGGINIHDGTNVAGRAKVYLNNTVVRNNHGNLSGGINIVGGSSLFIEFDSSIQSNKSDANGGGISCLDSEVFITNSLIGLNIADENESGNGNGGGIYLDNCDLLIYSHSQEESGIAFNSAINGGGIFATNTSDVYIVGQNTSVALNVASFNPLLGGYGGGVNLEDNSQISVYSAKIEGNKSFYGAGLYIGTNSSLLTARNFATLEECSIGQCTRIVNNEAKSDDTNIAYSVAGGIYAESTADVTINQAWISGNIADFTSALKFNANNSSVKHSMIINNTTNAKPLGNIAATVQIYSGSQVDFMFNTLAGNIHGDINAPVLAVSGDIPNANFMANIIQENTFVTVPQSIDVDGTTVIQCKYNLLESNTAVDDCNDATNLDMGNEAAFVDAANNNYHISSLSLAIDHASLVPTSVDETDIDNDEIIIADAGADEAPINRVGINGGACSYPTINEALLNATDGDILYLKPSIYNEIVNIDKDIGLFGAIQNCTSNIIGATSDTVIIDGSGITDSMPLVTISSDKEVTIRNLTVQHSSSGGIAWSGLNELGEGNSALYNISVINNQHPSRGGGLYLSNDAVVRLWGNNLISNNFALGNVGKGGGAFVSSNARLILRQDTKIGLQGQPNIATHGGGVYSEGGSLSLYENSEIGSNGVTGDGAGVYIFGQNSSIYMYSDSKITGNISESRGGGIYSIGGATVRMYSGFIANNSAGSQGGAIYGNGDIFVSKAIFDNNTAPTGGSAIYAFNDDSIVEIDNSLITNSNQSSAFHASSGVNVLIENTTFGDNFYSLNIVSGTSDFNISKSIIWGDNLANNVSRQNQGVCNIDEWGVISTNTQNPLFESGNGIDYLLSVNSPAIDACINSNTLDFFDTEHSFDGNYHTSSNDGDMGAFEYIPSGSETLTVNKIGTGTGTVISVFGDINCGNTCSDDYPIGLNVTLQATVDVGNQFIGWSGGGCSGTGDCTVTVDQIITVTAEFNTATDLIFKNDFE